MSSLISHLAAGATLFACAATKLNRSRGLLAGCLALAVLPDFDYLIWWFLGIDLEPRITHSVAFLLVAAVFVWLLLKAVFPFTTARAFVLLVAAGCSHLLLDYLIGVHPLPLFWPVTTIGFTSPLGILPSAGKLNLSNPYFWRNLMIEAGVLGPIFATCLSFSNSHGFRMQPAARWSLAGIWLVFLTWSVSLQR